MKLITNYKTNIEPIVHVAFEDAKDEYGLLSICGYNFNYNFGMNYLTVEGDYDGETLELNKNEILALPNLCKKCRNKLNNGYGR